MAFKPADKIQDLQYFGEFGGVNPSISDSSTYTFLSAKSMADTFEGNTEGCYLYSRHSSPSIFILVKLWRRWKERKVQMSAQPEWEPSRLLFCNCEAGDHIVASRTIYGGTYAFLKNFTPRYNIETTFVDITNLEQVENSITENTKFIYCESVSNPLLK